MRSEKSWARAFVAGVLPALLAGCQAKAPTPPDAAAVEWRDYVDRELQVAFAYPADFDVKRQGDDVVLRSGGKPAIRLIWVDAERGRKRGLWFGNPYTPATVAGVKGERYEYEHYDGPVRSRTISYVIPYRGRWLGLEFRTDAARLPAAYERVLESLRVDAGPRVSSVP